MQNTKACEHWNQAEWERVCAIVGHPDTAIAQSDMVIIRALNKIARKHQLTASMWMSHQETTDCESGRLADDMGLGKVSPSRNVDCYTLHRAHA